MVKKEPVYDKELGSPLPTFRTPMSVSHLRFSWGDSQRELLEMRNSSKVSQVENAIRKPIEKATWSISDNGADQDVVDFICNDFGLKTTGQAGNTDFRTGRFSWNEHLPFALEGVFMGVAFFEKVYYVGEDGRNHLRKLAPRPNNTISEIVVAEDGGLDGIKQTTADGEVFIPVERLVVYRNGRQDYTWRGRSVFDPARANWREMNHLLELQDLVLKRAGLGIIEYQASELTNDSDRSEELERGEVLARGVVAGDTQGYAVPPKAGLNIKGISGTLPDITGPIEWHSNQIAIACNATHLNLTGNGGSYALANVQLGEFIQGLQTYADMIATTATRYVIAPLVEVAFPDYDGPIPELVFTRIQIQKELTPGDVSQLAAQGVLTREPNLESWVRSGYMIPPVRAIKDALADKLERRKLEQSMGVSLTAEPVEESPPTPAEASAMRKILGRLLK